MALPRAPLEGGREAVLRWSWGGPEVEALLEARHQLGGGGEDAIEEEMHDAAGAFDVFFFAAALEELEGDAFERGQQRGVHHRIVFFAELGAHGVVHHADEIVAEAFARASERGVGAHRLLDEHADERAVVDVVVEIRVEAFSDRAEAIARAGACFANAAQELARREVVDGREDLLFALEPFVERAARDAGGREDVLDARRGVSEPREDIDRGGQDSALGDTGPHGIHGVSRENHPSRNDIEIALHQSIHGVYIGMLSPYWDRLASIMAPKDRWLYHDAHYLVADMEIDPAAAKKWIPFPLTLAKPARASIFTAWFPDNSFGGAYSEAGLFLHVEHLGRRAVFSPWMLVDDDVALITGRELLGYPKKMGAIDFAIDGDRIRGVATRRGAEIVRMEGTLGERVSDPPAILGRPHRNVRASLGLSLPKVIAFTPREEPIEVRRANITVKVTGSERDPLHELGFGKIENAYLHRVNLGGAMPPLPVSAVNPIWYVRQWLLRVH
jgi:acetoacetate decarboxylase